MASISSLWSLLFLYCFGMMSFVQSNKLLNRRVDSPSSAPAVSNAASIKDKNRRKKQLVPRGSCPVPCDYYGQLCCAANEICYTAPDLQAQCSPTRLPFEISVIITIDGGTVTTSLTKVTTVHSLSTEVTTVHNMSLSRYTLTAVETTTRRIPSVTTATSLLPGSGSNLSGSPSSSTSPSPIVLHQELPLWEKGVIGAGVSVGAVGLIVAAILLWRRRRDVARVHREEEEQRRMQRDGPTSLPPMDTAHISSTPSQRARQPYFSVPSLVPREPPPLYGQNPFDRPATRNGTPFDADHVGLGRATASAEDRAVSPVSETGGNFGNDDDAAVWSRRAARQHVAGPSGYMPVPPPSRPPRNMPRPPVGPTIPHATAEEDEYRFY